MVVKSESYRCTYEIVSVVEVSACVAPPHPVQAGQLLRGPGLGVELHPGVAVPVGVAPRQHHRPAVWHVDSAGVATGTIN